VRVIAPLLLFASCVSAPRGCHLHDDYSGLSDSFRSRVFTLETEALPMFAYQSGCGPARINRCYFFAITEDGTVIFQGNDPLGRAASDEWMLSRGDLARLEGLAQKLRGAHVERIDYAVDGSPPCLLVNGVAACYQQAYSDTAVCEFVNELRDISLVNGWGTDVPRNSCALSGLPPPT
jgi:hypothetical protein